ncbi:MAG: DinB family protein [Armatimonadetes bacterium]|nr:DinB family protein [Armatimonadota bacterium]
MTTRSAIRFLFDEILHGTAKGNDGTYFVQGGEALLATCAGLTAKQASRSPAPGVSSIAAHLGHSIYYLELALRSFLGEPVEGVWEASWATQVVTVREWADLQGQLLGLARRFHQAMEELPIEDETAVTDAIANVGHLAYHLGAIRVLASWLQSACP